MSVTRRRKSFCTVTLREEATKPERTERLPRDEAESILRTCETAPDVRSSATGTISDSQGRCRPRIEAPPRLRITYAKRSLGSALDSRRGGARDRSNDARRGDCRTHYRQPGSSSPRRPHHDQQRRRAAG